MLYPGLTALDAVGPYEVLRLLPDAEVRFVGAEPGPVVADSAVLHLGVTHSYAEPPRPDIVLVPGSGPRTATVMADRELADWLRRTHETTQWTTSVCSGALILAAAGILEGLPATTHWYLQSGLALLGAKPRPGERVVRAGKIVTAAGVSAGIDLGLWLAGEVAGREHAEMIQLFIEYDPHPPFDSGNPTKASEPVTRCRQGSPPQDSAQHRRDARLPDDRLAACAAHVAEAEQTGMTRETWMVAATLMFG